MASGLPRARAQCRPGGRSLRPAGGQRAVACENTRPGSPASEGTSPDRVTGDWVDLSKVSIPEADEQQRLLVDLIEHMNRDRKPIPSVLVPTARRAGGSRMKGTIMTMGELRADSTQLGSPTPTTTPTRWTEPRRTKSTVLPVSTTPTATTVLPTATTSTTPTTRRARAPARLIHPRAPSCSRGRRGQPR